MPGPKSNRNILERGKKQYPNTQIHDPVKFPVVQARIKSREGRYAGFIGLKPIIFWFILPVFSNSTIICKHRN